MSRSRDLATLAAERLRRNGIDALSGSWLFSEWSPRQLARIARRELERSSEPIPAQRARWRGMRPRAGADACRLSQSGWGVIFPRETDPAVREALAPLLEHRRARAERYCPGLYRECSGSQGYRRGESSTDFLARFDVGPGPVDPPRMPYYLLLVGGPEEIPFEFQYQLDVQYAVGRIHFDSAEEYHGYARQVIAREARPCRPEAAFFAVRTPGDRMTELLVDHLSVPLARNLALEHRRWDMETVLGEAATKERLRRLLVGPGAPALVFAACHGLAFDPGHPLQRETQGALICADWPGRDLAGPPQREHYLAAADLPADSGPAARVIFHFSCFGAGTPEWDDFPADPELEVARSQRLAPRGFVARLPQRLLARGAQAVIGHVERAWDWSFRWLGTNPQLQTIESVLWCLLSGHPAGSAVEYLNDRFAELSIALDGALRRMVPGDAAAELEVARLFVARNDARNYVLLGDPAVRLEIGDGGVAP